MSRAEIISELYDRSAQKVFELSANYLMTVAKKGYEEEFAKEKEIVEFLEGLRKESEGCANG